MNTKLSGDTTTSLSAADRQLAGDLYSLEEIMRANLSETVEIQTIMFLLEVARHEEPPDLTTVGARLNISKAAASRNFYRLADGKGGVGGLDLIKSLVDYQDRRRVILTLTSKGITLVKTIVDFCAKRGEKQAAYATQE